MELKADIWRKQEKIKGKKWRPSLVPSLGALSVALAVSDEQEVGMWKEPHRAAWVCLYLPPTPSFPRLLDPQLQFEMNK